MDETNVSKENFKETIKDIETLEEDFIDSEIYMNIYDKVIFNFI